MHGLNIVAFKSELRKLLYKYDVHLCVTLTGDTQCLDTDFTVCDSESPHEEFILSRNNTELYPSDLED